MKLHFLKNWPIFATIIVVLVFFWKVFLLGQFPIPADFIVGTYYPWLDYKWGYSVGVPVKNPVTSDVVSIVYPLRSYAVDVLKQGRLPLWNPFMFNGTPLLADFQIGLFSPTMFLYFIFPKIWAWTFQVMAQPLLASLFTYLLLRNFGLEKKASFFGGIFYAFASFNIIWMEWNANTLVAAFIPLVILLLDKLIKTGKLFWGILLSVIICLQIFSGYPQLVIFTVAAIFIYALFCLKELNIRKILYILLFLFLGLVLSSIITIPASELILNSQRKYQVLAHDLIYLPWQNLITIFAPDYFGNSATGNYYGVGNYAINAIYSGVVVFILALVGIFKYWRIREVKYFVFLIILSLLFALPTPLAKLLFDSPIPGLSASSNTRILILANLSFAVLAGFGINGLLKKEKIQKLTIIFIPLVILTFTFLFTYFFGINRSISLRNLFLPVSFSIITVALILLREKFSNKKLQISLIVLTLGVIAVVELFRYGFKYTPFSPSSLVFPETPVLSYLKEDKDLFRVSLGDTIPMNMWVPYNFESSSGYDAAYPIWWARLFGVITSQDKDNNSFSYYAPFEKYDSPWFDLLNNKYLFVYDSGSRFNDLSEKFEKVFQDKSVIIFKNNNVFPRAFFVSDWEVKSDSETLSTLIDNNFPLGKKIIIDKDVDIIKSEDVISKISYEFYSPERSTIRVNTNKDGFLFVSDSWYPGWRSRINGIDTPVYRANYAFKAVPVLKGNHEVEFIYDPLSLRVGKVVSFVALVFLVGLFVYEKRKQI